MSQPPTQGAKDVGMSSWVSNLPEDVSFHVKREDAATKLINAKRAEWQLQREKVIFYSALIFVLFAAISSVSCLFTCNDTNKRILASTFLTSILSALLGYLTGKSKSDSKG